MVQRRSKGTIVATERFENIVSDIEFLDEWEDRYAYIIELGKSLEPISDTERVPATKVDGCASQVWLVPDVAGQGAAATVSLRGDSDAMIVKGLIAVLLTLFDQQPVTDILKTDAPEQLARLGLDQHLSSQRSNGLRAMVERINEIARRTQDAA
jgi:cysteine desulfuration protein SufE